jgi:3-hydroxy-9,10-secoandrosta-1,3,5(10)-triene-9,17-dione monooxygenase reductase component
MSLREPQGGCRTPTERVAVTEPQFRDVMGRYATSVAIVTSMYDGEPVGMTVQAFVSASLNPPLVAFLPATDSTSWPKIRDSRKFCVNFLPASGANLGKQFARTGTDKFANVPWALNQDETPVLAAAISAISCHILTAYPAGDHLFVLGSISEIGLLSDDDPSFSTADNFGK